MFSRIVFPFLVISTTLVTAGTAEAAVKMESAAQPTVAVKKPPEAAIRVTDATKAEALEGDSFALRFREFESTFRNGNDQEVYLGTGDLGKPGNRVGTDARYKLGDNSFSLSLQGGTLSAMLNGNTLAIKDIFTFSGIAATQPLDTLRIAIRDSAKGDGLISLDNLTLSGSDWRGNRIEPVKLGSLAGVDFGGATQWDITGLDFRQDFALKGTLALLADGGRFSPSAELNKVDFTLGDGAIVQSAVPEVSTWVMMITGFAFVGTALRGGRRSGQDLAGRAAA
jgi:hypothetical protein